MVVVYTYFRYYRNALLCLLPMFSQNLKTMNMRCVCPECKNTIDLSRYPQLTTGMVIECNHCGMTLLVKEISDAGDVKTEIVDEGK
jgi:DNA-directed RNA polymerase subunit RPC12/RpoP